MTTYEQIIQKGEARGIQKGKIEKENLMITNAFKKGLDISLISEITGLREEEVKDRIKDLGLEE